MAAHGDVARVVTLAAVSAAQLAITPDAASGRPPDSSEQKWEHRVVETKDRAALQSELTTAGGDGWELVSATAMFNTMMTSVVYTLFFKRLVS